MRECTVYTDCPVIVLPVKYNNVAMKQFKKCIF